MPCIIDKSRKADALAEMWPPHFWHVLSEMLRLFLSSRTVAWSLTHTGFCTLEANLKKRMSYLVLGPKRLTYLYQQLHCHLENKNSKWKRHCKMLLQPRGAHIQRHMSPDSQKNKWKDMIWCEKDTSEKNVERTQKKRWRKMKCTWNQLRDFLMRKKTHQEIIHEEHKLIA